MTDPLSPDLQRLLKAERARPSAPGDAKAIARARLSDLLGPTAGLEGAARGTQREPAGGPDGAPVAPRSAASPAAAGGGLAKMALSFALGGVMTAGALFLAGAQGRVLPPRPPPPEETSAAAPSLFSQPPAPASTPPLPSSLLSASSASSRASAIPPATSPAAPARHWDRELAGERTLLERARSALARGDGYQALAAVEQHERAYKGGQLTEEREALAVQALVAAHRTDAAAERAASFRKAYPKSVLLPVVDEALR